MDEGRGESTAVVDDNHDEHALIAPGGSATPGGLTPATKPKRQPLRFIAMLAGIVGVFALAVVASIKVQRESEAAAPTEPPALAVLPFENVGSREGRDFAHQMTEEITDKLSSLHGLRVIGRQSVRSYAGNAMTPQQIAKELNVNYVLTGTVRWDQSPDGKVLVRVSPALFKSDGATQVWAEAYQTVLSGMFRVQAKVARQVASALNLRLLLPDRDALEKQPTDNPEAYGLYVKGKDLLDNATSSSSVGRAITYFETATRADPKFARAWAALAAAHTEYFRAGGDQTPARLARATQALDHAQVLDPESADLHEARGIYLYQGQRDLDGALHEFALAEQLRPNDYNVEVYKGAVAKQQGKWEEALESQKRAVELEPRNGVAAIGLAATLYFLQRYPEAESYINRGLLLSPTEADGARLQALIPVDARGNVPEAIERLREATLRSAREDDLIGVLQDVTWPALEDPQLRRTLVGARVTPATDRRTFYVSKSLLYIYLKDRRRARAYADSAIAILDASIRLSQAPWEAYELLALAHAARGDGEAALVSFRRADELLPADKDAGVAAERANRLPTILMLLGDHESAVSVMEKRAGIPGGLSRNRLRLDPLYAPLRGNPRFERLIMSS